MATRLPDPTVIPIELTRTYMNQLIRSLEQALNKLELDVQDLKADTVYIYSGSGSPETVVTAPVGSLYSRTDGGANTTLYVKESGTGNTGWIAK